MKAKSLKLLLSSLFRELIPGEDPSEDTLKLEKAEGVIEDSLQWADGGQIAGIGQAPRPSNGLSTLKPSEPHGR